MSRLCPYRFVPSHCLSLQVHWDVELFPDRLFQTLFKRRKKHKEAKERQHRKGGKWWNNRTLNILTEAFDHRLLPHRPCWVWRECRFSSCLIGSSGALVMNLAARLSDCVTLEPRLWRQENLCTWHGCVSTATLTRLENTTRLQPFLIGDHRYLGGGHR